MLKDRRGILSPRRPPGALADACGTDGVGITASRSFPVSNEETVLLPIPKTPCSNTAGGADSPAVVTADNVGGL